MIVCMYVATETIDTYNLGQMELIFLTDIICFGLALVFVC